MFKKTIAPKNTAAKISALLALLGGAFYMVWNSKQVRAMRTVHRTNMILRRVGNVLCKIAAADEACV